MSSEPNHNRQKNHKALTKKQKEAIRRKKRQRKIILLIVEILVVLILAIALFLISKLGKIERQEVPLENIEVNEGISEESKEIMKSYTTIALFGLDNRSNGNLSKGRSDVIMPISIMTLKKSNYVRYSVILIWIQEMEALRNVMLLMQKVVRRRPLIC